MVGYNWDGILRRYAPQNDTNLMTLPQGGSQGLPRPLGEVARRVSARAVTERVHLAACLRLRERLSAIMAINSEFVGFPLMPETV